MTRRDYVLLTEVCKRHQLPHKFLIDLCNALYLQNNNFNSEVFMRNVEQNDEEK